MIEEPCQTARLFLLISAAEVLLLMIPLSFSWISSPVDMLHAEVVVQVYITQAIVA